MSSHKIDSFFQKKTGKWDARGMQSEIAARTPVPPTPAPEAKPRGRPPSSNKRMKEAAGGAAGGGDADVATRSLTPRQRFEQVWASYKNPTLTDYVTESAYSFYSCGHHLGWADQRHAPTRTFQEGGH